MTKIQLATIGFTQTTAAHFFDRIRKNGIKKIIDVRLNNRSQLAGFAKANDLAYFLKTICDADYCHEPLFAPTKVILKAYKQESVDWPTYQKSFVCLLADRKVEQSFRPDDFNNACLLCSEKAPDQCHRSLVCEYLNQRWNGVLKVRHL